MNYKYWVVQKDESSVVWNEFKEWFEKKYWWWYPWYKYFWYDWGHVKDWYQCYDCIEHFKNEPKLITLWQWYHYIFKDYSLQERKYKFKVWDKVIILKNSNAHGLNLWRIYKINSIKSYSKLENIYNIEWWAILEEDIDSVIHKDNTSNQFKIWDIAN